VGVVKDHLRRLVDCWCIVGRELGNARGDEPRPAFFYAVAASSAHRGGLALDGVIKYLSTSFRLAMGRDFPIFGANWMRFSEKGLSQKTRRLKFSVSRVSFQNRITFITS
jgi:hypothetical protein